jgi:hypothetical protein
VRLFYALLWLAALVTALTNEASDLPLARRIAQLNTMKGYENV